MNGKFTLLRTQWSHRVVAFKALVILTMFASGWNLAEAEEVMWKGYPKTDFTVLNRKGYIVAPRNASPGNPWVWRARFPNFHAEADILLLNKGFHVAYVDVAGLFGSPKAVKIGDAFYSYVTSKFQLSPTPALEGVSRGGLFVYNWAAKNTSKVSCIYCDTPVCDFKSWPGGLGKGLGAAKEWMQCQSVYGMTEAEAKSFTGNPINHAKVLADAKIPIMHIVSRNDRVVPPSENTDVLKERLAQLGATLEIVTVTEGTAKSKGHHFTHPDPQRVADFIWEHAAHPSTSTTPWDTVRGSERIVFLGDSITYSGKYVVTFDAWLHMVASESHTVINVGLPSETISGLSEDGHAGGRFPRPDLFERLDRVLKVTKPDLVIACYGINCGIYQPFDEERFSKYQQGIKRLKEAVDATGARLVALTPPTYDDARSKKKFSYDSVMGRYSDWLVSQQEHGWMVFDLHESMADELAKRRVADPSFTFQPDSVHPNQLGHEFMAEQLIQWVSEGSKPEEVASVLKSQRYQEILRLVKQTHRIRRDAYLSKSKHLRPGIAKGMPLEEAIAKCRELTAKIEAVKSME